ncbi:putative ribonuclease H-like domain-containing protein [Tanacetum coccineum]
MEKGVIDSGCSRHITGNKCSLTEYEYYDGGFVSFRDGKGRISRKGKIKIGTLDFDNVYFCKELKYKLFSVSQICDKKNNVLFTDTECLVLSSDFKLLDESQVLLRVPRNDNIYSVDLKSVVPTKGLTCLFTMAIIDESKLWHRRLGHINFKNMNKLMRGNLARGLPSKIFENDHSYVSCKKGKQHKASYKAKLVNSISKPLHMLHMDLFSPTNVKSLMKKDHLGKFDGKVNEGYFVGYSVISKATRVFNKRTRIVKVKVIRSDNGTEFKNSVMNQFCERKGIKREFSVARTAQQNGVAERRNRTLIKAARTRDNIVTVDVSRASDKDREDNQAIRSKFKRLLQQEKHIVHPNSTNSINTVSTPVSTTRPSFTNDAPSSPVNDARTSEEHLFEQFSPFKNAFTLPDVPNMFSIDDTRIFGNAYDDEDVGAKADLNNLETTMNVSPIPTTRIGKDHPKDQIIGDLTSAIQGECRLDARAIAEVLSYIMGTGVANALYFASVEDLETTRCFLDCHEIRLEPMNMP